MIPCGVKSQGLNQQISDGFEKLFEKYLGEKIWEGFESRFPMLPNPDKNKKI